MTVSFRPQQEIEAKLAGGRGGGGGRLTFDTRVGIFSKDYGTAMFHPEGEVHAQGFPIPSSSFPSALLSLP